MADKKLGVHRPSGVSRTVQADAEKGDINRMASRLFRQRLQGDPNGRKPQFMEVPSESFHEMLNKVTKIQENFRNIPARVRARFANSPAVLLDWLKNPENRREGVKMGLIYDPELARELEMDEERKFRQTEAARRARYPNDFEDEDQLDLVDEAGSKAGDEAQPRRTPKGKPPVKEGRK